MQNRPEIVSTLADGLIRVIAPNPSPMTYWGTNTYILGSGDERVLIDPGPMSDSHIDTIFDTLPEGARLSHILVTHAHLDHSAGARALSQRANAPVFAFGDALAGRSQTMKRLTDGGLVGGGEGVDHDFQPDLCLSDNSQLDTNAGAITALHTPGHMANHLSFMWRDICFTGDLIMGWSSSLISPPDGDAQAFTLSCNAVRAQQPKRLMPAHGAPIYDPEARIDELLAHRATRESQILTMLAQGPTTLETLTAAIYTDLAAAALPYAQRNVLAHLIDLHDKNLVHAEPDLRETSVFSLS